MIWKNFLPERSILTGMCLSTFVLKEIRNVHALPVTTGPKSKQNLKLLATLRLRFH